MDKKYSKLGLFKRYCVELYAFLTNLPFLWGILHELSDPDHKKENKLLIPVKIAYKTLFKHQGVDISIFQPETFQITDTCHIYVNGICTTEERAKYEVNLLNNLFGQKFTLFYNHTNGFVGDIVQCIRMKIDNQPNQDSHKLIEYIQEQYKNGIKKFKIIGYSQGAIITCFTIDALPDDVKKDIEIDLITIGPAQDELQKIPNGSATHYAHEYDFVSRIGAIFYYKRNKMFGNLVIMEGDTHLLPTYITSLEKLDKFKILDNLKTTNNNSGVVNDKYNKVESKK